MSENYITTEYDAINSSHLFCSSITNPINIDFRLYVWLLMLSQEYKQKYFGL